MNAATHHPQTRHLVDEERLLQEHLRLSLSHVHGTSCCLKVAAISGPEAKQKNQREMEMEMGRCLRCTGT